MTRCAAVELGPHGVRVNSAATPLGRRGTAEEIARAVLFLAARNCPFMTGAELVVDGGLALERQI